MTPRRLVTGIVSAIATMFVIGCVDVNYDIGANFVPDSQGIASGNAEFGGVDREGRSLFTTRNYKSEYINTANQGSVSMGAQNDSYFGKRYTGFFSQYTPLYELTSSGFGYDPILDSVVLFMSVLDYSGDTTTIIKYDVYELLDNSILGDYDDDDDDDYYLEVNSTQALEEFSKGGVLSSEPLFSFYFPDQNAVKNNREVYISTSYMKMDEMTAAGEDFMSRLMLQSGEGTYELYDAEEEWYDFLEVYKGIYIVASDDQPYLSDSEDNGAIYRLNLSSSGLGFYARSKYEELPEYVKDTVGMNYTFYDTYIDVGGNSFNVTYHDSVISDSQLKTDDKSSYDVEATPLILVEGMGGIVNEITFEQSLFEQIAEIIAEGNTDDESDLDTYSDIFFNTATLSLYVLDADATDGYGMYSYSIDNEVDLDNLPTRLGLYSLYTNYLDEDDYSMIEMAIDYDYYTEYTYSTTSNYNGYLNRSRGCYTMNIPLHLQSLWVEYCDALEERGGEAFTQQEWDELDWNKLYIAPDYANLITPQYAVVQGMADGENLAPIRLQITYTLTKKVL